MFHKSYRRARRLTASSCSMVTLVFLLAGGAVWSAENREALRIMAEGYQANCSAFTMGKCRFSYSIRSAATEEDALHDRWDDSEPHTSAECA